jgi:hypothetical protein
MLDLSNAGTFMLCAMFDLPVFTMIDVAIEQGLDFYRPSLFDQVLSQPMLPAGCALCVAGSVLFIKSTVFYSSL